jgi:hypothetical protein
MNGFHCPSCLGTTCRVLRWYHPLSLHWILNPGLAVNEILLGQRVPRTLYSCDRCAILPMLGMYVHCPHCGSFHSGILWSGRNGFGHWFGYVCPDCGGRIPCLRNLTALVVLALTFPLWIAPALLYRKRWLARELRRVRGSNQEGRPSEGRRAEEDCREPPRTC